MDFQIRGSVFGTQKQLISIIPFSLNPQESNKLMSFVITSLTTIYALFSCVGVSMLNQSYAERGQSQLVCESQMSLGIPNLSVMLTGIPELKCQCALAARTPGVGQAEINKGGGEWMERTILFQTSPGEYSFSVLGLQREPGLMGRIYIQRVPQCSRTMLRLQ